MATRLFMIWWGSEEIHRAVHGATLMFSDADMVGWSMSKGLLFLSVLLATATLFVF